MALAGCLGAIPGDDADQDPGTAAANPSPDGTMTAEESTSTSQDVETEAPDGPFVATRTVDLQGEMNLTTLPANLSADRGEIAVETGPAGEWSARIQVDGYGPTPEDARRQRSEVDVSWSAGEPGDRRLRILAEQPEEDDGEPGHAETTIHVTVPSSQPVELEADLETGNLTVEDLRTPFAALGVANGAVDADLQGTRQVTVGVAEGAVDAAVHPTANGSVTASAANGQVRLQVPEDADHGYDARASTTNGDATIELEDGSKTESEGAAGDDVRFVTSGYEDRPVRTQVTASSTNGDVLVGPT